jgi:crossover junction endodeoxyribonuclease RuvC
VIVLGVDPGTAATGYGVVERPESGPNRLIECGVIRPRAREPLARRLAVIHEEITLLLTRHHPDAIAVETVFVAHNARSALVLGHARGVVLLAAAQAGLDVAEYAPRQVKSAVVGAGGATKPQVGQMVARLLRLKSAPTPADAADGVAIALAHCLRSGRPLRRAVVG